MVCLNLPLQLTGVMEQAFTDLGIGVITERLFFDEPPEGSVQVYEDIIQQLNVIKHAIHSFILTKVCG